MRGLLLVAVVGAPSCLAAELQIVNSSGTAIHELYLAAPGQRSWGADLLRSKQPSFIAHGESHTILDLAPGTYQLRLVDRDGRECEIESMQLASNYRLDLTNVRLRECTPSN
jgi:hypothetical protein